MTTIERMLERSEAVHQEAGRLSDSIIDIEDKLANLPGRVETLSTGGGLTLHFHRKGKRWIISCWADDNKEKSLPLTEAKLNVKLAATILIPQLVVDMDQAQTKLLQEINEANQRLETFKDYLHKLVVTKL